MDLQCANSEQQILRHDFTYSEWGTKLTLEQYREREIYLGKRPWAISAMQTWFLVDAQNNVLSSCESFAMESKFTWQGELHSGISYGIASVFTEKKIRGRGYASLLLTKLTQKLKENINVQAIFLFSDIGETIYEKLGFKGIPSWNWVLRASAKFDFPKKNQIIHLEDFAVTQYKAGKNVFVINPTLEQLDWHYAREDFYASVFAKKRFGCIGAKIDSANILWTIDYKNDVLQILYMSSWTPVLTEKLLQFAQKYASVNSLQRVHMWESECNDYLPISCEEKILRSDKIPMLLAVDDKISVRNWSYISRAIWV